MMEKEEREERIQLVNYIGEADNQNKLVRTPKSR